MRQVLVYSGSLSWGIIPTTRNRLPFEPGRNGLVGLEQRMEINSPLSLVMFAPPPISTPRGPIAPKFTGAGDTSIGLAEAYRGLAAELDCHYFDAGSVIAASPADGIHLDADQHRRRGTVLAGFVAALPSFARPSER